MQKDYEPLIDAVRRTPHAGFQFEGNRLIQHSFHLLQTNAINIKLAMSDENKHSGRRQEILTCTLASNYRQDYAEGGPGWVGGAARVPWKSTFEA